MGVDLGDGPDGDRLPSVSDGPFISYGQNREDVVLWRALGSVSPGRYVEVGANDPVKFSITKAFYDREWHGMSVEPDPSFVARLREARPRDDVVGAAVTSHGESVTLHLIADTGLSTLDDAVSSHHAEEGWTPEDVEVRGARLDQLVVEHGYDTGDVHFLIVDVEGFEADVLSTVDLRSWRPWVLVIEATAPLTHTSTHTMWEPAVLDAGYEFCLFDGVSRFYVASERAGDLKEALSYPACALDSFVDADAAQRENVGRLTKHIEAQEGLIAGLRHQLDTISQTGAAETLRWRRAALVSWATTAAQSVGPQASAAEVSHLQFLLDDARQDAAAVRQTVSWRVTRPLRGIRRLSSRGIR